MNNAPNTARLTTETCQRSLATSDAYCRKPTKLELGSIRDAVNEIHVVHAVQPTYTTTTTSNAGDSDRPTASRDAKRGLTKDIGIISHRSGRSRPRAPRRLNTAPSAPQRSWLRRHQWSS